MEIVASAMPSHLHFPPELWSITMQNFRHRKSPDELTYLWTTLRHVSRQFKEEIETIFRTEHLPKTWLHLDTSPMWVNKPNGRVFDFNIKLRFDRIQPRNLGRAAFTIRPVNSDQERASFATPVAHRRRIFKRLRDEVGSGRLGGADSSVSGSRIRLFESPRCLFVVQVRGSVVNCALPALNIDSYKHELSFEWRGLFSRFFGERKETAAVLHDAPIDLTPAYISNTNPDRQKQTPFPFPIDQVDPSLQALAQLDWHKHCRHIRVQAEGNSRVQRLNEPIQTWTDAMQEEFGQSKATLRRCRLRRQADQEIDLDDEGNVNQKRLDWETEGLQAAGSKRKAELLELARSCDTCRKANLQCGRKVDESGLLRDCERGSLGSFFLAGLNMSWTQVQPTRASQEYQMQLMLLEQQNVRRSMRPRGQATTGQSYPRSTDHAVASRGQHQISDHALRHYREAQQSSSRVDRAQQTTNSMGLTPAYSQPAFSNVPRSPPRSSTSQDHETQSNTLVGRNEPILSEAGRILADGGQSFRSGSYDPGLHHEAPLRGRKYEKQPMQAQHDQSSLTRQNQPQPTMASDGPATAPILMVANPTHPDRQTHPAEAVQSGKGL